MEHLCYLVVALFVVGLCYLTTGADEVVDCFFSVSAESTLSVVTRVVDLAFDGICSE